jgi:hypothetical protein
VDPRAALYVADRRVPVLIIVYLSLAELMILVGIEVGFRVVLQANALTATVPDFFLAQRTSRIPRHHLLRQ